MQIKIQHDFLIISAIALVWALAIFPALEAGSAFATTTASTTFSQTGIQVTARQQVTAEMSLTIASTSIILSPAIPGLTGGTGDGSTNVNIVSNNREGFDVTIQASTSPAMKGDSYGGQFNNYGPAVADTPDLTWVAVAEGTPGVFGFGITNISENEASGFTTGCDGLDNCFLDASTTAKTIYSHNASTTAAGNSFTLKFRAQVPANSSPAIVEDWYSATTTITAVMK